MTDKHAYKYPGGPTVWLTTEEAEAATFCPMCGYFVGGIEYDDFCVHHYGICSECIAEAEEELESGAWD